MESDKYPSMGPWTKEQDDLLQAAVEKYQGRNWKQVALMVPGRTPIQCYQRVKRTLQPGMVKGHWTQVQDKHLRNIMSEITGDINWQDVAKKMGDRTAMQCRMRWVNHLNPNILRQPFTQQEDAILLQVYDQNPQQWRLIAQALPQRTEDMVRKRYAELQSGNDSVKVMKDDTVSNDDHVQAASSLTKLNPQDHANNQMQSFISLSQLPIRNMGSRPLAPLHQLKYHPQLQPAQKIGPIALIPPERLPTSQHLVLANPEAQMTLLQAIKDGDLRSVVKLTKAGIYVEEGLMIAAKEGGLAVAAMLIAAGARAHCRNQEELTPLHVASLNGHAEMVQLLVASDSQLNVTDRVGKTPLYYATENGHLQCVEYLLKAGADTSIVTENGLTALDIARRRGYDDITSLLRKASYRAIEKIQSSDLFDLEMISANEFLQVEKASLHGKPVLVETILKPATDVTTSILDYSRVQVPDILPLLAYVAEHPVKVVTPYVGELNIRQVLDERRRAKMVFADRNEVAYVLANALRELHEAKLVHRDLSSRSIIQDNGCWKLKLSYYGQTRELGAQSTVGYVESMLWSAPEVIASTENYSFASDIYSLGVILCELDTLMNPYENSTLESFPLLSAIQNGNETPTVREDCEPWYRELARTCLQHSPSLRPSAIEVAELIKQFADTAVSKKTISAKGVNSAKVDTLFESVKSSDTNAVEKLIEEGVDVNVCDSDGLTPLIVAVKKNQLGIVETLLSEGNADASICDNNGTPPVVFAIQNGNRKMARILHKAMSQNFVQLDNPSLIYVDDRSQSNETFVKCKHKGNLVLVKQIREGTSNDEEEALKCCLSPYIIQLLSIAQFKTSQPKMILEYMDGGTLRQYLNAKLNSQPTPFEVTPLEVAWVVANALMDLHNQGFVHGDLKSENVLLCSKKYIKLGDLGCSCRVTSLDKKPSGSVYWMAPEMLREKKFTFASDVYSFGVLLTELDALQLPYWDSELKHLGLVSSIMEGKSKPTLRPNCEEWYRKLTEDCLAYEPRNRPLIRDIVDLLSERLKLDQELSDDMSDVE